MKRLSIICLVGAISLMGFFVMSPCAFAGVGWHDQTATEPPYGIAVQSDAAGTKLDGVISIEFFNFRADTEPPYGEVADARFVLRLKQGNAIHAFYGETDEESGPVEYKDNEAVHEMISSLMREDVLACFFGDCGYPTTIPGGLDVKLKAVGNLAKVGVDSGTVFTDHSKFAILDVTVAVKSVKE